MTKLQFAILSISIILIIIGITVGDVHEGIFIKAVNICLECIGIG